MDLMNISDLTIYNIDTDWNVSGNRSWIIHKRAWTGIQLDFRFDDGINWFMGIKEGEDYQYIPYKGFSSLKITYATIRHISIVKDKNQF